MQYFGGDYNTILNSGLAWYIFIRGMVSRV